MSTSLDTAGTEQFGGYSFRLSQSYQAPVSLIQDSVAMRDLYMKSGQGFLLVFSITSRASLEELATLREEIIRIKDDEDVPLVIVGNKADLMDQRAVDRAKAFSVSQLWQAPYYEASARTRSMCIAHGRVCFVFLRDVVACACVRVLLIVTANSCLLSANVDEVFIDLCRQMLRRYDNQDDLRDDIYYQKAEDVPSSRRRRRRSKKDRHSRCVIL